MQARFVSVQERRMYVNQSYGTAEEYGTKDVQMALLDLLKKFHAFCENNEISYSLNSGTALGAIRHKGFIPWDDDADIMMDRYNFQKLLSLKQSASDFQLNRITWIYRIHPKVSEERQYPLNIDIFVVDNVPDSIFMRKLKLLMIKFLQGSMKTVVNYSEYTTFYKICSAVAHITGNLFKEEQKYDFYQKVSQLGNGKYTRYVGIYNNIFKSLSRLYPSSLMEEIEPIEFEDTKLYITKKWHDYLSLVYGDYMIPPSVEDRKIGSYTINLNGSDLKLEHMKHIH